MPRNILQAIVCALVLYEAVVMEVQVAAGCICAALEAAGSLRMQHHVCHNMRDACCSHSPVLQSRGF